MAFLEKYKRDICKSAILLSGMGLGRNHAFSPNPLQVFCLKIKSLYPVFKLVLLTQLWNKTFCCFLLNSVHVRVDEISTLIHNRTFLELGEVAAAGGRKVIGKKGWNEKKWSSEHLLLIMDLFSLDKRLYCCLCKVVQGMVMILCSKTETFSDSFSYSEKLEGQCSMLLTSAPVGMNFLATHVRSCKMP